jgi:hypothetical protein
MVGEGERSRRSAADRTSLAVLVVVCGWMDVSLLSALSLTGMSHFFGSLAFHDSVTYGLPFARTAARVQQGKAEMQRLEDTSTPVSVGMAILGYSLCSSTLLLANKMAIEYLPVPSVVSFIQILSSAVFILVIKVFGVSVDSLEW